MRPLQCTHVTSPPEVYVILPLLEAVVNAANQAVAMAWRAVLPFMLLRPAPAWHVLQLFCCIAKLSQSLYNAKLKPIFFFFFFTSLFCHNTVYVSCLCMPCNK